MKNVNKGVSVYSTHSGQGDRNLRKYEKFSTAKFMLAFCLSRVTLGLKRQRSVYSTHSAKKIRNPPHLVKEIEIYASMKILDVKNWHFFSGTLGLKRQRCIVLRVGKVDI